MSIRCRYICEYRGVTDHLSIRKVKELNRINFFGRNSNLSFRQGKTTSGLESNQRHIPAPNHKPERSHEPTKTPGDLTPHSPQPKPEWKNSVDRFKQVADDQKKNKSTEVSTAQYSTERTEGLRRRTYRAHDYINTENIRSQLLLGSNDLN